MVQNTIAMPRQEVAHTGARLTIENLFCGRTHLPVAVDAALPMTWDGRIAYLLTQLGSPPVLVLAMLALTAGRALRPDAWLWAGVYLLVAIMAPLVNLIRLVRQGWITDLDVQLRKQRFGPLLFTVLCAGTACLVLLAAAAPALLVTLSALLWAQLTLIFMITLRWKISVHAATAGAAAMFLWHITGQPWGVLIMLPLIGWTRVRLGRHTLSQTLAGALLGLSVFALLYI